MSQSCDLRIEFGQSSSFESYQHVSFYLRSSYINSPRVFKSCEPLRKIQSKSNSSIASVYLVPFVGHKEHHFANSYLSTNGYNFVRYTAKGGKPFEFDIMDKSDWKTFKTLIANPNSCAKWKALYYVTPTKKSIRRKTMESHMQRDLLLDPTKKKMLLKRTLGRLKNQAVKM